MTLQGKNKGKPLSRTRRHQLGEELAREWGWLNDALEECADLDKRIAELEGRTEKPPA